MYQGKMAFAIKVGGKILRERGETVHIPFGSEYSLLIKNLSNRNACVKITIDGQEAVDDGLIVRANSSVDLERFVKRDQMQAGNRFKFIERTVGIEQHRGIGIEDGLIRVEFEFEKEQPKTIYNSTPYHPRYFDSQIYGAKLGGSTHDSWSGISNISGSLSASGSDQLWSASASAASFSDVGLNAAVASGAPFKGLIAKSAAPKNDAGITVGGSVSTQKFTQISFTGDGITSVMVMKMRGEINDAPVEAPITVKTKQLCNTCGFSNKASSKFCSECGTGLEVVSDLKSRFKIGDYVACKGYKHQVRTVTFSESKVFYGLAFHSNLDGEVMQYPSEDVYPVAALG